MHERDEDYDIRLHNSYFYIAEARGKTAKVKDALHREIRRREAERVAYNMTIDRLRKERDGFRTRVSEVEAELKVEKEKNDEVARIWREDAREQRILPKPVAGDGPDTRRKRKAGSSGGAEQAANSERYISSLIEKFLIVALNSEALKTPSTPTTRSALAAKDNQLNRPLSNNQQSK